MSLPPQCINTAYGSPKRKMLNRGLTSYLKKIRYYTIVYANFEDKHPSLFDNDGIQLSFIGNDIFMHVNRCFGYQ
jgi:hypothetical protein